MIFQATSPELRSQGRSYPLEKVTFCVLDTETTGVHPATDRVVETAWVLFRGDDGIIHHASCLVNPGRLIPQESTAIHGLTDADVADARNLDGAMELLHQHAFDVWVAHNAPFDFGFIDAKGIPVICTLMLARRLWPDLPNHKNQGLREFLTLEVPEAEGLPAHRAEPDALVTAALLRLELKTVQERFPEIQTLGDFLAWMSTPFLLPVCVIGNKHRGKPWSEVPSDYLRWVLENDKLMDQDVRASIQTHSAQQGDLLAPHVAEQ